MKYWVTDTGEYIKASNWEEAEEKCPQGSEIQGQLISQIPTLGDGVTPNWGMRVDYDNLN